MIFSRAGLIAEVAGFFDAELEAYPTAPHSAATPFCRDRDEEQMLAISVPIRD